MNSDNGRALGRVAYDKDSMMFITNFVTRQEVSSNSNAQAVKSSSKLRWSYLVVGYKESQELRASHPDNETLLDALQAKYVPLLKDAITKTQVKREEELRDQSIIINKKAVYLQQSQVTYANSMKMFLRGHKMESQAKALTKEVHIEKGAMRAFASLPFTSQECHQRIQKERRNEEAHAFAVVALAYLYNKKDGELVLSVTGDGHVGLLPRIRFECGVFFDGTNNNQFNTDLRQDYEKYVDNLAQIFSAKKQLDPDSWQGHLFYGTKPKEELLPLVFEELKKSIASYAKNVKMQEQYEEGSWLFNLWQDKASSDADAVYRFTQERLVDVLKRIEKVKSEKILEQAKQVKIDTIVDEAKLELESNRLILESLLPEGEGSSYTGEDTNVVKLYELYKTETNDIKHEAHLHACTRAKIYITGAGTYDPREIDEHDDDAVLFGSALAICGTGVRTKVNQACKDLKTQLRSLQTAYLDTLVLDVFGFSRGAAEARHFVGSLCKDLDCSFERKVNEGKENEFVEYELGKKGENLYAHLLKEDEDEKDDIIINKIVFRFVGIFDTVPHEGLVQSNDVKDLNLKLEKTKVSSVVHLTAKDEFRYNFDLVSIFSEGEYKEGENSSDNFIEKEFFGAHSDIGGGYTDNTYELIELPSLYYPSVNDSLDAKTEKRIRKWNKDHAWVKGAHIEFIQNKSELEKVIKEQKELVEDGFYINRRVHKKHVKGGMHDSSTSYHIYMYRKNIDTEYSQIPFEYMYEKARRLTSMQSRGTLSYKDIRELEKQKVLELDADYIKTIKSRFLHHSSQAGIAHHANSGDENGLYGKRDIHYV